MRRGLRRRGRSWLRCGRGDGRAEEGNEGRKRRRGRRGGEHRGVAGEGTWLVDGAEQPQQQQGQRKSESSDSIVTNFGRSPLPVSVSRRSGRAESLIFLSPPTC